MVVKCHHSEKVQRVVADVCQLYRPKQSLPKKPLPTIEYRQLGKRYFQFLFYVLHGRLFKIQPNFDASTQ